MSASAAEILSEHVTGGTLDLNWVRGFDVQNKMFPKTLDPADPAYANPSGDHTVAVAQTSIPDSGGIIVTSVDPGALNADYAWEGWFFTGNGDTRRGLTLRADPTNDFKSFYMFVIEQGLFTIRFRKIVNEFPTTIAQWTALSLPAQEIPLNSWHKMKVIAQGNTFRCFFDDVELTAAPIVDNDIASGWVGVYQFRFDAGGIQAYFDDFKLTCLSSDPLSLDLTPGTLNLKSMGKWVTAYIEPTAPATPADIDVASLRLNGAVAPDPDAPTAVGDHDGDGVPDLMVKFPRDAFEAIVPTGDAVPVTVTGSVAGGCAEGATTIRVIRPPVTAPAAGAELVAGAPTTVRWETAHGVIAPTVALLVSYDDGAHWTLEARDIANVGAFDWTVPSHPTTTARVAIVQIESGSGDEVEGVLSVSESFTITGALAVGAGAFDFGLRALENPSAGAMRVSFTLPTASRATLAVYEINGRLFAKQDVNVGAGVHHLTLAEGAPAGMYVVRLTQDGRAQSVRMAVVR